MGMITRQTTAELRKLPMTLGKLLGGVTAVIAFTAAVVIMTRKPGLTLQDILPSLLFGCAGIAIFVLSARVMPRRSSTPGEDATGPANRTAMNVLPWVLLLLFAAIFLAGTYLLTR